MTILIAVAISVLVNYICLKLLQYYKFRQTVRVEGPQSHYAKSGTPTMGGLGIIATINILAIAFIRPLTNEVIVFLSLFTLTGLIGFLDDILIIKQGKNNGLKPRYKLLGQGLIAALFCTYLLKNNFHTLVSPFLHLIGMDNPILYVVLSTLIIIGFLMQLT